MTVWAQPSFSQRATWPPSAAVRQRSIALITFSCSRLIWPRLASRQTGPWSRKISATSRLERAIRAALRRLGTPTLLAQPAVLGAELFERTIDVGNPTRGNARIARCRVQLGMSEKSLDVTNVQPALEQMGCKRVAQRMQADPLTNARRFRRLVEEAAQLPRRKMLPLPTPGE